MNHYLLLTFWYLQSTTVHAIRQWQK